MNVAGLSIEKSCCFCISDWQDYGCLSDADKSQSIPMAMAGYLNEPCPFVPGRSVKETHFLFFLPSELDGIVLTINSMRRLLNNQSLLRFNSPPGGWFARHDFANFSADGSWKMLFVGPLTSSKGLTYKKQQRLFRQRVDGEPLTNRQKRLLWQEDVYMTPFARTVVAMIILRAKKFGQISSKDEWGRTFESYDEGLRVRIGVFKEGAICLSSRWSGKGYSDTGIFAEKIF